MIFPIVILAMEDDSERTFMQALYCEHYRLMHAKAYDVLRDKHLADDAVHDAILSLIDAIKTLQGMACPVLTAYVVITVRNAAVDLTRERSRQQKRGVPDPEAALAAFAADEGGVDAEMIREADLQALNRALDRLPEGPRRMLEMKYYQGLSEARIAREFAIQPESARKAILRARQKVRQWMEEEENGDA